MELWRKVVDDIFVDKMKSHNSVKRMKTLKHFCDLNRSKYRHRMSLFQQQCNILSSSSLLGKLRVGGYGQEYYYNCFPAEITRASVDSNKTRKERETAPPQSSPFCKQIESVRSRGRYVYLIPWGWEAFFWSMKFCRCFELCTVQQR